MAPIPPVLPSICNLPCNFALTSLMAASSVACSLVIPNDCKIADSPSAQRVCNLSLLSLHRCAPICRGDSSGMTAMISSLASLHFAHTVAPGLILQRYFVIRNGIHVNIVVFFHIGLPTWLQRCNGINGIFATLWGKGCSQFSILLLFSSTSPQFSYHFRYQPLFLLH